MEANELKKKILALKKEKNAVILAHYYQDKEIQMIADFVGDSYNLSLEAANSNATIILFAGVHFMAETAKLLNPNSKVILPDLNAGCSLADSCQAEDFKAFIADNPECVVVTYVNCSAEIKMLSDIVCTSSNAEKIIRSIPEDKTIVFAPDKNLGKYLIKKTGRNMVLWDGSCIVHEAFSFDKLLKLMVENPNAKVIAHPESESHILELAHYIGSTAGMLKYVKNSEHKEFIVATEAGILFEMSNNSPEKTLIPAPVFENNTCACSECAYMKLNTLQKVYDCLLHESPEISLDEKTMKEALKPLQRMISITNSYEKV